MRGPEALGRTARALGVALALGALPPAASADEAQGEKVDIASFDLESLLDLSVEAVSLHEERASESAGSVFVLSRDDIRRQGFRTLQDALATVPGLFAYEDGLYPMVGVRGVGLLGDYTTRLLVLVDGHPLNNSVGIGQSYLGRDLPVPFAAVRRIEVIKGPVGSVYGPTAFVGVVNLVTTGTGPGGEASMAGDGAQTALRSGELGVLASGARNGVSWMASAEAFATRGFDHVYPELARTDPGGGRVRGMDFADALQSYVRASWRDLTASASCGRFSRGIASAPYSSLLRDDRNTLVNRTCFVQLGWSHAVSSSLALQARASYDDFLYGDTFAYAPPPDDTGMFFDDARDRWLSADARLTWSPRTGTRVVAGTTGKHHDTVQHSYTDAPAAPELPPIEKTYRTLNAYLLAEQAVGSTLTLHGGLTFYAHEIFGSRVTPRIAGVWQPSRSDTVKLIYSEGFRAPTATEAFFADGVSYLANPDVKPETVRSIELGYERRLGGVASVSAHLFQVAYRNLIAFGSVLAPGAVGGDPSDYREIALNMQGMRVRGGELGLRLAWRDALHAWGGVSVQAVDGADHPNFPKLTATFALSSRALWRPLTLSLNGSVSSGRAKDPTIVGGDGSSHVPPALLLNAFTTLELPRTRGLSLELGIQNLLGARALDPVPGDFAPLSAMPRSPRTVRAGFRYRF
jgi:iron complex outermembrane receptor protein